MPPKRRPVPKGSSTSSSSSVRRSAPSAPSAPLFQAVGNLGGGIGLVYEAGAGHLTAVKASLDRGVPVDTVGKCGFTPLRTAVVNGHTDVVKLLLARGADPALKETNKRTALHLAALQGHEGVVTALLDHNPAQLEAQDDAGHTSLTIAAGFDKLGVVQVLLKRGARTAVARSSGYSALNYASKYGNTSIVKELLDHEAPINVQAHDGWSPLMTGAHTGHLGVVKLLLARGADPTLTETECKRNALHLAAQDGHDSVVAALLDHSTAGLDVQDDTGNTPLALASGVGHLAVVRVLLQRGASVVVARPNGSTALYSAACKGHAAIAQELLNHDAPINARTEAGYTALRVATVNGHPEVAKLLLDRGADPALTEATQDRQIPLHLAKGQGGVVTMPLDHRTAPLEVDAKFAELNGKQSDAEGKRGKEMTAMSAGGGGGGGGGLPPPSVEFPAWIQALPVTDENRASIHQAGLDEPGFWSLDDSAFLEKLGIRLGPRKRLSRLRKEKTNAAAPIALSEVCENFLKFLRCWPQRKVLEEEMLRATLSSPVLAARTRESFVLDPTLGVNFHNYVCAAFPSVSSENMEFRKELVCLIRDYSGQVKPTGVATQQPEQSDPLEDLQDIAADTPLSLAAASSKVKAVLVLLKLGEKVAADSPQHK